MVRPTLAPLPDGPAAAHCQGQPHQLCTAITRAHEANRLPRSAEASKPYASDILASCKRHLCKCYYGGCSITHRTASDRVGEAPGDAWQSFAMLTTTSDRYRYQKKKFVESKLLHQKLQKCMVFAARAAARGGRARETRRNFIPWSRRGRRDTWKRATVRLLIYCRAYDYH